MTEAQTLTLTDFLLARIAEDEASLPTGHDCWYKPERYEAECEAKRRIAQECHGEMTRSPQSPRAHWLAHYTLMRLALPYADHPDYSEEWRP